MRCWKLSRPPDLEVKSSKRPMDDRVEGFLYSRRISCLDVSVSLVAGGIGLLFLAAAVALFFKSFLKYGFTPSQSTQYVIQTVFLAGGLVCLFLFVKGILETTIKIYENIDIQDSSVP